MAIKAIILLGGSGTRFGHSTPKQFLNLSGKKVYLHTVETFLSFLDFKEIILVTHPNWIQSIQEELKDPRVRIIPGGKSRQESSYLGLLACGKGTKSVVIHDGARPTPLRRKNFPNEDPSILLSPKKVAENIFLLLKQRNTTGSFFEIR